MSNKRRKKLARRLLRLTAGAGALGLLIAPIHAAPQDPKVVHGTATITRDGNLTTIQAGNNSIINYSSFSIFPKETVRFVQPGASSRVLNRVTGLSPSLIQGSLHANGVVYLVNPAGVYFARGSVVNVGGIYAAAGSISDANFLSNVNLFTSLTGSVINEGTIRGDRLSLIGRHVANLGSIRADHGFVTMLAGDEVYVKEQGGRIIARVDGTTLTGRVRPAAGSTTPSLTGTPGVENAGTIEASHGRVVLGAGDLYSLAVRNTGTVRAPGGSITLGAADGAVHNAGTLDVSVPQGAAGSVVVQGPSVANSGVISADSASGGAGYVEVTSDNHTYLLPGSVISASGGAGVADGGFVLVHSYDGVTVFADGAAIDVSGGLLGGDGGFVEVSGQSLVFMGYVDLLGGPGAADGALLIDPRDLIIADNGANNALLADRLIDFSEPDAFTDVTISDESLEAITGSITLRASRDLLVNQRVDLTHNNDVTLEANRDLVVNAPFTGARNFTARADADQNAEGAIFLNGGSITSSGMQRYFGDTYLGADTTLMASGVRFEDRLNSPGTPRALTVFGSTTFAGPVGDMAPLASISVAGASNFLGGPVITTGPQTYMGTANVIGDTTLTGTTMHFFDVVEGVVGAEALGIVGNAIFDGAVGELRVLQSLSVSGTTLFNGGFVHTVENQDYTGAATLGVNNTLISDTGDIRFHSTIDGAKSLGVFARQGIIQLGDSVGGATPLASLELAAGPLILINGPLVHATGDIIMNEDGKALVPTIATIAAPDGDLLILSDTGDFLVGPNEKITNIGALTINVAGTATVGDLNSLGDMTVTAGEILIRLRPAGVILNSLGGIENDDGVDFVTGGSFFFSVAPTTIGAGAPPQFGSPLGPAGDALGTLGAFGVTQIAPLTADKFKFGETVLDLRVMPLGGETTGAETTGTETTGTETTGTETTGTETTGTETTGTETTGTETTGTETTGTETTGTETTGTETTGTETTGTETTGTETTGTETTGTETTGTETTGTETTGTETTGTETTGTETTGTETTGTETTGTETTGTETTGTETTGTETTGTETTGTETTGTETTGTETTGTETTGTETTGTETTGTETTGTETTGTETTGTETTGTETTGTETTGTETTGTETTGTETTGTETTGTETTGTETTGTETTGTETTGTETTGTETTGTETTGTETTGTETTGTETTGTETTGTETTGTETTGTETTGTETTGTETTGTETTGTETTGTETTGTETTGTETTGSATTGGETTGTETTGSVTGGEGLAEALPAPVGPIPFADRVLRDVLLGPPGRAGLQQMAIDTRTLRAVELRDVLAGREVYNDLQGRPKPEPLKYTVAVHRLRRATAQQVLEDYRAIFSAGQGADANAQAGADRIREALAEAWRAYAMQPDAEPSGVGFREFLKGAREHADALAYLDRLDGLFRNTLKVGLTPTELTTVMKHILTPILPKGMTLQHLADAIDNRAFQKTAASKSGKPQPVSQAN